MNMEQWWNDIFAGETEVGLLGENLPSATLSTTNPTWIDPGANPGLRGERPATNRLSHGTALHFFYSEYFVRFHVNQSVSLISVMCGLFRLVLLRQIHGVLL
jgi:hypothetical protein